MKNTAEIKRMAQAQTFGVEIEMSNITRENAAKVAAEYFGTYRYENTNSVHGYMAWSAWDTDNNEWVFVRDVSITGPDSQKTELVTPVLRYSQMELLQGLCRALRKAGAKSSFQNMCGCHIHIGLKADDGTEFTPRAIRCLANLMASHEDLISEVINIAPSRKYRYCKPISTDFVKRINKRQPADTSWDTLMMDWYGTDNADDAKRIYARTHYDNTRYSMLNLHSAFSWMAGGDHSKPTVEYRMFQFEAPKDGKQNGIHAGKLRAYIEFCLHMSAYAKLAKSISPKTGQRSNKKFAMRTWLLRLGFIGDEYKNTRKHLLANLTGNTAWRFR